MAQKITIVNEPFKEIEFTVQLGETGTATYITDEIKGYLENIETCITTENGNSSMYVTLFENNIPIFDTLDNYLPKDGLFMIRDYAVNNKMEKLNYTAEKFLLNHKLRFEFQGTKNTEVIVKIRVV
jgi:hypothetical protein